MQRSTVRLEGLILDLDRRTLERDGRCLRLTTREAELLTYFLDHANETVSREALLTDVWGYAAESTTRTVDLHVQRLRKKLEADPRKPQLLLTVTGKGYRLVARTVGPTEPLPLRASPAAGVDAVGFAALTRWVHEDPVGMRLVTTLLALLTPADVLLLLDQGPEAMGDAALAAEVGAKIARASPAARDTLLCLAWFAGPFDLTGACQLLASAPATALASVTELLGSGLAESLDAGLFRIPWPVRAEARRRAPSPDLWQRHAEWILGEKPRRFPDDILQAALRAQDSALCARIVAHGLDAEQGTYWLQPLHDLARRLLQGPLPHDVAWRLRMASVTADLAKLNPEVAMRELATLHEHAPTPIEGRHRAYVTLVTQYALGNHGEVLERIEALLTDAEDAGDVLATGRLLVLRGAARSRSSDGDGAFTDYEYAYRLLLPLPPSRALVLAAHSLGVLMGRKRAPEHLRFMEEVLRIADAYGDPAILEDVAVGLGNTCLVLDEVGLAERAFARSRALTAATGYARSKVNTSITAILLAARKGDAAALRVALDYGFVVERASPNEVKRSLLYYYEGFLQLLLGHASVTLDWARRAGMLPQLHEGRRQEIRILEVIALRTLGRAEEAHTQFRSIEKAPDPSVAASLPFIAWFLDGEHGPPPAGAALTLHIAIGRPPPV